jgi:hypothetical protein
VTLSVRPISPSGPEQELALCRVRSHHLRLSLRGPKDPPRGHVSLAQQIGAYPLDVLQNCGKSELSNEAQITSNRGCGT